MTNFTVQVPISQLLSPMMDENPAEGTPIYDGTITITGECILDTDEDGQYWECDYSSLSWIIDGTTVEIVGNPTIHDIVGGSDSDLDLRAILAGCEDEMGCLLAEEAEYLLS